MKLRLLFFAAFLSLASCSSDDSTDPVNENPDPTPPVEKSLKRIEEYSVSSGGDESLYQVTLCENNKISQVIGYTDSSVITTMAEYYYDGDGRLSDVEGLNNDSTISYTAFEYDEQGRLTHLDGNFGSTFTYDDENNIVTIDNYAPSKYHFDEGGNIYKIESVFTEYTSLSEIDYEGNNILSYDSITFTYDYDTPVKGEYLNLLRNTYGSFNNIVLLNRDFNLVLDCPDNYTLTGDKPNSLSNYYYEYSFDEDGYPIEVRKISSNLGIVMEKTVIEYN